MPRAYQERWPDHDIHHLILSTEDFVVYLDDKLDLDWATSKEYDKKGPADRVKHHAILNEAARLETTPCDGISIEMKTHFKRLIGEAIARSLDHDYGSARNMLATAAAYILARRQETARFWYLSASAAMTAPFVLLGCLIWLARDSVRFWIGDAAFWLVICGVAGAVGALLSVIGRSGRLTFDNSAGKTLHHLEGTSRIWAGAISGLLVGLAVRSEIVFTAFSRGERMPLIMTLAALAAGSGERLASSIISDLSATEPKPTSAIKADEGKGGANGC